MSKENCRRIGENYLKLIGAVELWKWLLSSGQREKDRRKFIKDGKATQDTILYLIDSLDQETGLRLSTRRIEKRLDEIKKELKIDVRLGVVAKTVTLKELFIENEYLEKLGEIIKYEKNPIVYLDLENCNMINQYLTIIMDALMHPNNRVMELDLSINDIGDRAVEIIIKTLKHPNNKIRKLYLSNNSIGKPGVELLADALKDPNNKLVQLNLQNNRFLPQNARDILEEAVKKTGRKIIIQV